MDFFSGGLVGFFYIKEKHLPKQKIHSTEASHLGNAKKEEYVIIDNECCIRLWVEQNRIIVSVDLRLSLCSKMDSRHFSFGEQQHFS